MDSHLTSLATSRLTNAFCQSTKRAYATLFKTFLAFTIFLEWDIFQVTVFNLLCFLECLNYNKVKASLMANYLSAIKANFIVLGLDVSIFQDVRIKYYQKAVQLSAPMNVKLKKVIDVPLLLQIIDQCNYTYMGQVFKPLYLLAFYSFLRMSNLVPHSMAAFSPLRHLAQGDVMYRKDKIVLLIKWSKTMQYAKDAKLITIPKIPGSPLCPVTAISNLLLLTPRAPNLPLFQYKVADSWVPLTDARVRRHLNLTLDRLGLADAGFTFHSFRRSGATFAFNNDVALQNIQRHGTWTSDCVWRYITDSVDCGEQVANMFRHKISSI